MSKGDRHYEVGYGKPPKNKQFVKGESGHSEGRPPGSKNLASVFARECRQRVQVNGRTMTKLELVVKQLVNKAAQGDIRAQSALLAYMRAFEAVDNAGVSPLTTNEVDQKGIENLLRRIRANDAADTSATAKVKTEESK